MEDFENMRKPGWGGQNGRGQGRGNGGGESKFRNEVIVRSLPFKASEDEIQEHFSQYGDIQSINLLKGPDGGSKGICFIRFETEDAMIQAINSSGSEFMDRRVNVEKTKPREERDQGGFGGRPDRRDNFGGGRRDDRDDRRPRRDRDGSRERSRERERNGDNGYSSSRGQSKTVFVGNLNFQTSEDGIRDFFENCGNIQEVRIGTQPDGKVKESY